MEVAEGGSLLLTDLSPSAPQSRKQNFDSVATSSHIDPLHRKQVLLDDVDVCFLVATFVTQRSVEASVNAGTRTLEDVKRASLGRNSY